MLQVSALLTARHQHMQGSRQLLLLLLLLQHLAATASAVCSLHIFLVHRHRIGCHYITTPSTAAALLPAVPFLCALLPARAASVTAPQQCKPHCCRLLLPRCLLQHLLHLLHLVQHGCNGASQRVHCRLVNSTQQCQLLIDSTSASFKAAQSQPTSGRSRRTARSSAAL
ncbi:hypothetical protein COO60DRAFT_591746 [Scenedesmus sp. NREL 46B-D3]|nr:hypothetical protein COO60DRAFT_591746 [Scenedesmus sp. NREL 46B-D3]